MNVHFIRERTQFERFPSQNWKRKLAATIDGNGYVNLELWDRQTLNDAVFSSQRIMDGKVQN